MNRLARLGPIAPSIVLLISAWAGGALLARNGGVRPNNTRDAQVVTGDTGLGSATDAQSTTKQGDIRMSIDRNERSYVANHAVGFFVGLLVGGLVGSATMLLVAPQSGKKTRAKIQQEGLDLRDQVVETVEDAVAEGRGQVRRTAAKVRRQTNKLQRRGQDALDAQVEIVTDVVEAEKEAVQDLSKS